MTYYDLPAPAKLNLFLHVVGRRSDHYHLLESVFRLISLSDSITLDLRCDGQISRQSDILDELAPADDLVVKAARALQQHTGTRLGAHIVVQKRIPVGGGLGGGSSDAATVLIGLNRLWRTGLTRIDLARIGLGLGADVPFFIFGQSAFVQGVGERLDPVCLSQGSYLVVKPCTAVPTASIFKATDLTRDSEPVKISDFSSSDRFVGRSAKLQEDHSFASSAVAEGFGRNDLEPVVKRLYPVVQQAMDWVSRQGFSVRLSGSGSCFFAETDSPEQAELARLSLIAKIEKVDSGIGTVGSAVGGAVIDEILACDGMQMHPLWHWLEP